MLTLLGVAGWPVAHSRSPAMQNAALRHLGLDWLYVRLPLAPERFGEVVPALAASGYRGVNVTVPHKLAALALADRRTAAAEAIGAANTLTFADGETEADNTDAAGFIDALGEPVQGRRALVLGAGGSARAVAWALREAGAEVAIWNRTAGRAAELAADLGVETGSPAGDLEILVNATAVGMWQGTQGDAGLSALGLDAAAPPATLVDLVYGARPTALCRWAEQGGARVVDGLEVLVRQGAHSLRRWTGSEPPIELMRRAAHRG